MQELTLDIAERIVDACLARGRDLETLPLTVVALDTGGHVKVAKRADGAGILRFEIAFGKAWGALGMGLSSRALAERAQKLPGAFTMLSAVAEGRMVAAPGGVLIRDNESSHIVGSLGVSGDTSEQDEICAIYGIEAVGLVPDAASD